MSKRIMSALVTVLLTFSMPHLVPVALAQSSFGKDTIATPANQQEWRQVAARQLMQGIRHADSALAMHGRAASISSAIRFTIARDEQVTDFALAESTGNAALDGAIIRAVSRVKQVAPFTPDMKGDAASFVMQLETNRR